MIDKYTDYLDLYTRIEPPKYCNLANNEEGKELLMEEEKGYLVKLETKANTSIYCVKDYNWCMITITENFGEGSIWLKKEQLNEVIENLKKIQKELE